MTVDVGAAAEEISAGFDGGLGKRGVVDIGRGGAVYIAGFCGMDRGVYITGEFDSAISVA